MKIVKSIAVLYIIVSILTIAGTILAAEELKSREPTQDEIGKAAICPVMDSTFRVEKHTAVIDYKGKSYFFCCDYCVKVFKENPEKYAEKKPDKKTE